MGIYRYATEGSFDTYMWQTVERKAKFINQVMRGRLDSREIEDISDDAMSFAEIKALSSGDPLILNKAKSDAALERLKRLERAWQRGHQALRSTITAGDERARARERQIATIQDALPGVRDTRGDLFTMTVNGRSYTHRTAAAGALAAHLATIARGPARPVAELAGLQIDAKLVGDHAGKSYVHLCLHGLPAQPATVERAQLRDAGLSLIRQLEHRVQALPELADKLGRDRGEALGEAAAARDQLARPFKYADQLADARQEQQRIDREITDRQQRQDQTRHAQGHADASEAIETGDRRVAAAAATDSGAPGRGRAPHASPSTRSE